MGREKGERGKGGEGKRGRRGDKKRVKRDAVNRPNVLLLQHSSPHSSSTQNHSNVHISFNYSSIIKTKQNKTKQNKTKQNKTKQNKTKQNKTKQNKTKQNKTKQGGRREEGGGAGYFKHPRCLLPPHSRMSPLTTRSHSHVHT